METIGESVFDIQSVSNKIIFGICVDISRCSDKVKDRYQMVEGSKYESCTN